MSMQTSTKTIKTTTKNTMRLNTKKVISIVMINSTVKNARTITTRSELTTIQAMRLKCTISLFIQKTEK